LTPVLAGALGIVVGLVIGTLGGGGGVLAVPALVYALGQDARTATTSSIIIVGVISVVGVIARARGRNIDWRTGIAFGVIGVPAAWAGTLLNRSVPQPVLLLAFAALTLAVAALMLFKKRAADPIGAPPSRPTLTSDGAGTSFAVMERVPAPLRTSPLARAAKVVIGAAVVGFVTGFLGVGGGFLVVPALTLVLAMDMPAAIATSLLVISLNSLSSLAARAGDLQLDWSVVLPFTVVAIVGALAGKLVADRLSSVVLNQGFAFMLVVVGAFVGIESLITISAG
jgi:uncharacterized membrane protein YfcA